ncbi:hypothetical protein [Staphylococcus aureus]
MPTTFGGEPKKKPSLMGASF